MKLTKLLTIILFLSIGITTPVLAQVKGGRKKEHRNQRGGGKKLFGNKSKGNAATFAKGGKRKSLFARIFQGNKSGSAWVYHKTQPGKKQKKEQAQLFSRNRTKGKQYTDGIIAQQNRKRSATRVRGNQSFSKRKR